MERLSRKAYDVFRESTYDKRIEWFKEARLGLFIHYGLFSQAGRGEWLQVTENYTPEEYAKFADTFMPKEGCCEEWCKLAKTAGAKYAVLTTRHHEGFSLWDSKVNPFNSMNYCGRDIVREFVDACRKYDLKIGFYSSVMDWHHPDGGICAFDLEARSRFIKYIEDLNVELLSNYGKIDILWYDMPWPLGGSEAWDSWNRNYRLRQLQPGILINNRSRMAEDFQTPEESVGAPANANYWEACMTFNGISWGYIDSNQASQYSYSAGQIIRMLRNCTGNLGNLLINIGPTADGTVPSEAIEPLTAVGKWLEINGEAVYGKFVKNKYEMNNVSGASNKVEGDKNIIYCWNFCWPNNGKMNFGGFRTAPKKVTLLQTGENVDFHLEGERLVLDNIPTTPIDKIIGVSVIKLEFEGEIDYARGSYYPQVNEGQILVKK